VIGEPGGEQAGEHVAVPVTVPFTSEVHAQSLSERRYRSTSACHLDQIAKVPFSQRDNHERDSVTTGEVLAVLAVDGVAQTLALGPIHLRFGQQSQISRRGQRDILERQADARAHPGLVAAADGGDDGQRGVQAAAHIPSRQYVVDRTGMIGRAGDERESDTGVHGVVHSGGTVTTPEELNMDHVGTLGGQAIMAQPGQTRGVGDDDAVALNDQPVDQLLTVGRAQIDGGRTLSLVQSGPVDRRSVCCQWPSLDVGSTTDRIDTDHLRAKLAQRHATQRCGDETRHLHDCKAAQRQLVHVVATRSKTAASPWPPPMHMVSSP
jgi:hypothetical protein